MTVGDYLVKSLTAHSLDLPPQAAKVSLRAASHAACDDCTHRDWSAWLVRVVTPLHSALLSFPSMLRHLQTSYRQCVAFTE